MSFLDIACTGNAATGQREPLTGVLRNLAAVPGGFDVAELRFILQATNPDGLEIGVYVDGNLSQRVPATATQASLANLADGRHVATAHTNRTGAIWPERHGDPQGSRAYLKWPRSEDATCAGYNVYMDDGITGNPTTLVATQTAITIDQRINVKSANGSPGRVTFYGTYNGTAMLNDAIVLDVHEDGTYNYSTYAGLTGEGEWGQGQSVALPYGAFARLQDDPADYGESALYGIYVGPQNDYLSGELDPGTYTFEVRAFDAAGNENAVDAFRKKVRILHVPGPIANLQATYTLTGINFTWQDPEQLDGVRIYTNYDPVVKRFRDYVITDAPLATVPAETQAWTFTPAVGATGLLLFYARPYLGAQTRRDLTLNAYRWPARPNDLGLVLSAPTNVKATAIAAGGIRVEWDYRFREADALDEFHVSISGTSGVLNLLSPAIDPDTGDGFPIAHYTVEFAGPYTGTKYVQVQSELADNVSTALSAEVSVVPDSAPPDFEGPLYGVPQ